MVKKTRTRRGKAWALSHEGSQPAESPVAIIGKFFARQAVERHEGLVERAVEPACGVEVEARADEFFPAYTGMMNAVGRERGWAPIGRREFDELRSPRGAPVVPDVNSTSAADSSGSGRRASRPAR